MMAMYRLNKVNGRWLPPHAYPDSHILRFILYAYG